MPSCSAVAPFEPHPRALRKHRLPAWFEDAKLGIFVHWGLYAIPGWAPHSGALPDLVRDHFYDLMAHSPYAEWYWNALRIEGSPTARRHREVFGKGVGYESFREPFEAMLARWDPEPWADLFAASGARYVVVTTKHHDGYLMWPSRTPNPRRSGWQSERDTVGELAAAVRARGMAFGVYYSGGLDWTFAEQPIHNTAEMLASVPRTRAYAAYVDAHYRELIARYQPSVLWNDIAYPPGAGLWQLFSDYYEAVPEGVVNDRFQPAGALNRWAGVRPVSALLNALIRHMLLRPGAVLVPPRPPHSDFRTPEYASFPDARREKWEATRGIGHSFGWNRDETEADRVAPAVLIQSFVDTVSKNGNLLLNVGPTGDGEIPPEQASRLRALGAWLRTNGGAIHGTRPWVRASDETAEGIPLRFTRSHDAVHAILMGTPTGSTVTLPALARAAGARIDLLGAGPVTSRARGADLLLDWPTGVAEAAAYSLRIEDPRLARDGAPG
jgi:alpha-L-fucosidase